MLSVRSFSMNRWTWWLIPALGLGIAGGAFGLGVGCTRTEGVYSQKELKKFWKAEAKRPLPPPQPEVPRSERERRVERAIQTIKDMCTMLRQEKVPVRGFAERFGTDFEELSQGLGFQPHDPAFRQTKGDYKMAEVRGTEDDGVAWVYLHTADEEQLTLADLERAFGKGHVRPRQSIGDDIDFSWEPPGDGPLHCRMWVEARDPVSEPTVVINVIHLDRGSYDMEGGFWFAGMKVPTECVWCDGRGIRKAAR
jgi:hypothetical protein